MAIANANTAFKQQSGSEINDEKSLVALIRVLNRDNALPIDYVTTKKAKETGWDGTGSLWSKFLLNKKIIGGDPYWENPYQTKGAGLPPIWNLCRATVAASALFTAWTAEPVIYPPNFMKAR